MLAWALKPQLLRQCSEGLLPAARGGHRGGTVVPAREAPRPRERGRRGRGLAASTVGSGAAAPLWGGPCV